MGGIPLLGGEMNIEHANTRPQDLRASEGPPALSLVVGCICSFRWWYSVVLKSWSPFGNMDGWERERADLV